MSNYDNTNKGAMWRNDNKQSDTHPDFKGSINIDGVEYWLSGWKRKAGDKENAPVVRFSYQPKEQQQAPQQAAQQAPQQQAPQQQAPQQQAPQQQGDNFDDIPGW